MTADLPRVAVLGLPRGGTSLAVGLLRILGWRLPGPQMHQRCWVGESALLRSEDNVYDMPQAAVGPLVRRSVEPGEVWKDPTAGRYLPAVRLHSDDPPWYVVDVHRSPWTTAASEGRWSGLNADQVKSRNRRWRSVLDAEVLRVPDERVTTLGFSKVRGDPVEAAHTLANRLRRNTLTASEREAVEKFVEPGGGYRCPLPGRCHLH